MAVTSPGLLTEPLLETLRSRAAGYDSIILWTVSALTAAAHLYESAGFRKVEEKPGRQWGVEVVEERYELRVTT